MAATMTSSSHYYKLVLFLALSALFEGLTTPRANAAIDPYLSSSITCSDNSNIQVLFDTCVATSIHDSLNRLRPNIDSACGQPGSSGHDCCICSNYKSVEACFNQFCIGQKLDINMLQSMKDHCTICYAASDLKEDEVGALSADGESSEPHKHGIDGEEEDLEKKPGISKGSIKAPVKGTIGKENDDKSNKDDKKDNKKDVSAGRATASTKESMLVSTVILAAILVAAFAA